MAGWTAAAAIAGAAISGQGAASANQQSAVQAKRMYKHRYQWTVADLKAAGLNPMLAVQNGAPVPNSPQVSNVGEAAVRGASAGFNAAQAFKLQREQLKNLAADTELKQSQAAGQQATAVREQAAAAGQYMQNDILAEQVRWSAQNAANQATSFAAGAQKALSEAIKSAIDAGASQQVYDHQQKLFPIVRMVESARARGLNSEADVKELLATLARSIEDSGVSLSEQDYKNLAKETVWLIQDKSRNAWEAVQQWWQRVRQIGKGR